MDTLSPELSRLQARVDFIKQEMGKKGLTAYALSQYNRELDEIIKELLYCRRLMRRERLGFRVVDGGLE